MNLPSNHQKFWKAVSVTVFVVLLSSYAGSLFQLQMITQKVVYLEEKIDTLEANAQLHADKQQTYELITLLMQSGHVKGD